MVEAGGLRKSSSIPLVEGRSISDILRAGRASMMPSHLLLPALRFRFPAVPHSVPRSSEGEALAQHRFKRAGRPAAVLPWTF